MPLTDKQQVEMLTNEVEHLQRQLDLLRGQYKRLLTLYKKQYNKQQ